MRKLAALIVLSMLAISAPSFSRRISFEECKEAAVPKDFLNICLRLATEHDDVIAARQLVGQGANNISRAFVAAAEFGHMEMILYLSPLFSAQDFIFNEKKCYLEWAIREATKNGHSAIVAYLISLV